MLVEKQANETMLAPANNGRLKLRIGVIREQEAFAALRDEWDELSDNSDAAVFNSWEWLYPWYTHMGQGRKLAIYTARDQDGRLMGILPLSIERRWAGGLPVQRLAFLGETHVGSDYLDVVARKGFEQQVIQAFAYTLIHKARWDILDLIDMDEESQALALFKAELERADFITQISEGAICPYELFAPGENWDQFLRHTARRDNFLRRKKWLEKQPGYSIEKVEDPALVGAALEDFFRVHALRWAVDGGSEGITGPVTEAFHREAVQLLAQRGMIRLYMMRLGETTLASVYGMLQGDKFIYYQSGYDPDWAAKSVGLVLVGETFKDSIEAGLREYDFLRGVEPYKFDWTTRTRATKALRAFRPRRLGHLADTQERTYWELRGQVKRMLPHDTLDKLRRLRKRVSAN